jgi:MerR family transcriptional regulator, thiopeptide resistance regulator
MGEMKSWFGPKETARRLGVTAKARRVYEREGLVVLRRAESGWRLYGPAQIARLHQIVVLRYLGLSLKAIKTLVGSRSRLRDVLRLQRETLESQQDRITRAIALIETAQRRLDEGRDLSLDDLPILTRETVVQPFADTEGFATRLEALIADEDPTGQASRAFDQIKADVRAIRANRGDAHKARLKAMMAEAGRLTEAGDVNSEATNAFVRRMRPCTTAITRPAHAEQELIRNAYAKTVAEAQARSEPIPFDPAIGEFLRQVALGMKERGELD